MHHSTCESLKPESKRSEGAAKTINTKMWFTEDLLPLGAKTAERMAKTINMRMWFTEDLLPLGARSAEANTFGTFY